MPHSSVIVLGSGSAGLTAALYAARANLSPIVLEGKEPGGQLTWTTIVENFPGFPEGIMGPELMENMRKQAQRFGADCRFETAVSVDLSHRPFRISTRLDPSDPDSETTEYETDALIVATGASARTLGLPDEMHWMGNGLSTCATCDGALYRGKKVGVVGGGDSAVEEATFLTRYASRVWVIHRRGELRASKIMQDRLYANPKIEMVWNAEIGSYVGVEQPVPALTGAKLVSTKDGSTRTLEMDGLFLAIGHNPNTAVFKQQLATTPEGYLLTRNALAWANVPAPAELRDRMPNYGTATSIEGVFACGDVVDTHYRQAITAAGTGCAAAIDCEKWLEEQHSSA